MSNLTLFASERFAEEQLGQTRDYADMDNLMLGGSLLYKHPFAATGKNGHMTLHELMRRGLLTTASTDSMMILEVNNGITNNTQKIIWFFNQL